MLTCSPPGQCVAAVAWLIFAAPPLNASPIQFDEALDGDLPAGFVWSDFSADPPTLSRLFAAGNGTNTITGTFGNGSAVYESADVDSFGLEFAAGQSLISASLEWSFGCVVCPPGGDTGLSAAWVSRTSQAFFLIGPGDPTPSLVDATHLINAPMTPLDRPVESWFRTAFAASAVPAVNYTWTFTVVPAPGGFWLLGTGLLPVAINAARKRLNTGRALQ